jgi:hypothetical protein
MAGWKPFQESGLRKIISNVLCFTIYSIEKRKCENGDYGGRKATKNDELGRGKEREGRRIVRQEEFDNEEEDKWRIKKEGKKNKR